MIIRTYLRRSKNDAGKQQFSLDVQREGTRKFVRQRLELADVEIAEYLDDGKAGDDFHSRVGMRRLFLEAQPGDIIVCRDQSRLGRDAIEVTLAIRDLVRDRGCRLYYYVTGQQVQFANAIDQATTFIQGTGHQMELEAVRSRTREALRSRVREGRIAGGRCYGYDLVRKSDPSGRGYTVAVVNEAQAAVVRRIYADYLAGRGLKAIARALNRESVPCPTVGKRGSGSWSPAGIRAMLRNSRYQGVYAHGRIKSLRRGGKTIRQKADPSEVITIDVPEWRIVDDETWFAVQEKFDKRASERKAKAAAGEPVPKAKQPAAKYPLAGLAKCGVCGGAIGCAYAKRRGERIKAYACIRRQKRGGTVCTATTQQPMDEVEALLIDYLRTNVATKSVTNLVLAELENEVVRQMPVPDLDIEGLEAELKTTRTEQRRLAKAVALADDIPELVDELHQRSARIRHLEGQLIAAKRTPQEVAKVMARVKEAVRDKLGDLQSALTNREDLRALFRAMFPEGLTFTPEWGRDQNGRRKIWRASGYACFPVDQLDVRPGPRFGGCNAAKSESDQLDERPQRDLNPCRRRERPVS